MTQATIRHREFSLLSVLFIAAFLITLVAATSIDIDALLQYYGLISGSAVETAEIGSMVSAATALPMLAMGMSISADAYRNQQIAIKQATAEEH